MKAKEKTFRFGFLGIGKMAQAILRGMLSAGLARPGEILVSRTSRSALKDISQKLQVASTLDNTELARRCRWIWLGVKPFQAQAVLREIAPQLGSGKTVLSMMAGISTRTMRRLLGPGSNLIRIMPNTPALLGVGMSGVFFPRDTPSTTRRSMLKILRSLGEVTVVAQEAQLDAVTGLSGSGPAFVYELARGLVEGGIRSGLKSSDAKALAYQTLLGAARMLQATGKPPEELIAQVATKGGTTEAGLKLLEAGLIRQCLAKAVEAASDRARELKEQNETCIP